MHHLQPCSAFRLRLLDKLTSVPSLNVRLRHGCYVKVVIFNLGYAKILGGVQNHLTGYSNLKNKIFRDKH
jgi:hypothetical protein